MSKYESSLGGPKPSQVHSTQYKAKDFMNAAQGRVMKEGKKNHFRYVQTIWPYWLHSRMQNSFNKREVICWRVLSPILWSGLEITPKCGAVATL